MTFFQKFIHKLSPHKKSTLTFDHSTIPFAWRGDLDDAVYQASLATSVEQVNRLKRSVVYAFFLNLSIPLVALAILVVSSIYSSIALRAVCIVLSIFLFLIVLDQVIWLTNAIIRINRPDRYLGSCRPLSVAAEGNVDIEGIPLPPPTYQLARTIPPAYNLPNNPDSTSSMTDVDPNLSAMDQDTMVGEIEPPVTAMQPNHVDDRLSSLSTTNLDRQS